MTSYEDPKASVITPFNLDPTERAKLFAMPLPDQIELAVFLVRMPTACPTCVSEKYSDIHDDLLQLISTFPSAAASFGIRSTVLIDHGFDEGASLSWLLDIPWGRDWQVDGLYTQIGIHNPAIPRVDDPTVPILAAMHNADMHVAATGTSDPSQFKLLPVDRELADEYAALVNDIYYCRVGIWSQEMVDYRIMTMIKTRALLLGRNPDAEYDWFVSEGGSSLVDYLFLCCQRDLNS